MELDKIKIVANETSSNQIAILLALILESGIKGSLTKNRAEVSFSDIMIGIQTNYSRSDKKTTEFDHLVAEIINCWALPILTKKGINKDTHTSGSAIS